MLNRRTLAGVTIVVALILSPLSAPAPASAATTSLTTRSAAGPGSYTYRGTGFLSGQSVKVWYNVPSKSLGAIKNARIHFVMHGMSRGAESYRNTWIPLLSKKNVILITPEFSAAEYPGSRTYNQGSVVDRAGTLRPRASWSFSMIEAVFRDVVKRVGSTQKDYTIFGHSAGGQFVHRFIEFMPQAHVRQAVAANPGWYTVPDATQAYPYGLKNLPTARADLTVALSRKFTLLLGADDTNPHASDLQRDVKTDKQGITRLSRGFNFFRAAKAYAGSGKPFNWNLKTIPGVGHSHKGSATVAASLLFP